jgi:CRP-like cAMP-binding protein
LKKETKAVSMSVNEFEQTLNLNLLLKSLPRDVLLRMWSGLELVDLKMGQVLHEASQSISSVYFPTTAVASMFCVLENKDSAEIAIVGNEGMLGVFLFMSQHASPSFTVVQAAGQAYRLDVSKFNSEFYRAGPLFKLMLRYIQALITQMTQNAVCNRHHSIDQQLCRWLLLSLDRSQNNELVMTHEQISAMLGVRRVGVTVAAGKLQAAGLIQYHRGKILVLSRRGLEARVCECYPLVQREFECLLGK